MIIRDDSTHFIMITQEDHAVVSGDMAAAWNTQFLASLKRVEDMVISVYSHDKAWKEIDAAPFYNDTVKRPFSFIDYPVRPKLIHYKHGIDLVESTNLYAGLLNSLHYCSLVDAQDPSSKSFFENEKLRQKRIKDKLGITGIEHTADIEDHFQLLQLCDSLSLFICMNSPGTEKVYYNNRDGFKNSHKFPFTNGQDITAAWKTNKDLQINPFPFNQNFSTTLRFRSVDKKSVEGNGLMYAWQEAVPEDHVITIQC
ncbi:DUF3891 family protein [Alkalicoccus saliphilus]|uniref:DUF3891 domain-containing protein n=1 Tax=Alkalicoccus saliphilus TaxID=200989 RepID=A0A2T4U8F7_9BACI|nr:DUF3891 family protein [Alkalicoccus saliphilus]PTL39681.1 hypothetical protein C6Y45_05025 [Alkalicoccus saliphilus]